MVELDLPFGMRSPARAMGRLHYRWTGTAKTSSDTVGLRAMRSKREDDVAMRARTPSINRQVSSISAAGG